MLLDTPLGKWLRWPEPVTYAGLVENSVRVIPARGAEYTEHVVVPTEFYVLLLQTETAGKVRAAGRVSFYLEEYNKHWVFGYFVGEEAVDLWYWTRSTLPNWVK
jgi:hypothetical protein